MRILHTSDWHLGLSTGPHSRGPEQRAFLQWLLHTLEERQVDALIVAGDVFDSFSPSAEALAIYYQFLAQVAGTGVLDVVVVGGNHDSPSQLDAPRAVLNAVNVHVVGGLPPAEERAAGLLIPLHQRVDDAVAAICVAVPYVHEYRLGLRTTDLDAMATSAAFQSAFSGLYKTLCDQAEESHPGVPLVGTGHLTLGVACTREDYPQEIHQVGTIAGLPPTILDERLQYVALGHIHRGYRVKESKAWYCGTPLPYSLTEAQSPRHVLLTDLDSTAGAGKPERINVPKQRDFLLLQGKVDEVLSQIETLTWDTPFPPLLHICLETKVPIPDSNTRVHAAVQTHTGSGPDTEKYKPLLVEVKQLSSQQQAPTETRWSKPLDQLSAEQVFSLLCDARALEAEEREQLTTAFQSIASAAPEDIETRVNAIEALSTEKGERA